MGFNLNLRNTLNLFKHLPKCNNFNRLPVAVVPSRNFFRNSFPTSSILQNVSTSPFCSPATTPALINVPQREFHLLKGIISRPGVVQSLFAKPNDTVAKETKRGLVQFGYRGRRKTVTAVLCRFKRLNWGIWIHPRTGRHNKLWRKGPERVKRSRTHVFCNATQSYMLDKMVGKYWRKKKYYVDDPYENYQTRPDFWITRHR